MNGYEVHHWPHAGFPSKLLDPAATGGKPGQVALFRNKTIGELDWAGNVVWQWGSEAPRGAARQHHDWYRSLNGNTLVLSPVVHPLPWFAGRQPNI